MKQADPLQDGHGRFIRDVRVSVTDRCNFRCQYCMPSEGLPWLEREQVLTFEELARLVAVLATMGVCDIRLTGGEPLVRRGFPRLAAMLAAIDDVYPLEPVAREPGATARVYRFTDGSGKVGFINPVSDPFCGDCDRIRLTADGQLRTCLFSRHETDLRAPLRNGAADDELREIVRRAVWRKELKHHVNEPGFQQPERTMSQIGG